MIILINLRKVINCLILSDMQRILMGTLILLEVFGLRGYQITVVNLRLNMKTSLSAHFNNNDIENFQPNSHQRQNSHPFDIIRRTVAPFIIASACATVSKKVLAKETVGICQPQLIGGGEIFETRRQGTATSDTTRSNALKTKSSIGRNDALQGYRDRPWKCTDLIFIRHAESTNNCLYDKIRDKIGVNIEESTIEREENLMHESDCALSPRGVLQSTLLETFLSNGGIRVLSGDSEKRRRISDNNWSIYSSPMKRCLLTSQQVSIGLGAERRVTVFPFLYESQGCYRLNERNEYVIETGFTQNEVETLFPNFKCSPGMEKGWYLLPYRESQEEFLNRATGVVNWLWTLHRDRSEGEGGIILVSHGNLMNAVISSLISGQDPVKCSGGLVTHHNTGITHLKLYSSETTTTAATTTSATATAIAPPLRFCNVQYMNRVDHLQSDSSLLTGNEPFHDHWVQEFLIPPIIAQ